MKYFILILNDTQTDFSAVKNDYGFIRSFHSYNEAHKEGIRLLKDKICGSFKVYEEV